MQTPIKYRNQIPFYYDKTANDFRQDPYERYDPMVIRQSMIHLADHLWGKYPMQEVMDFIQKNSSDIVCNDILEIGCGVGRCVGSLATHFPKSQCWGIDYSYQMLKQAKQVWIDSKNVKLSAQNYGFSEDLFIEAKSLSNLSFGLAQCEDLPFADDSLDIVISSFLIDRLLDPILGLKEMKRVLRPKGKIVIVTPFNFRNQDHWNQFYPLSKFQEVLVSLGFEIIDCIEDMMIHEPIDRRGNKIVWNCSAMVFR